MKMDDIVQHEARLQKTGLAADIRARAG